MKASTSHSKKPSKLQRKPPLTLWQDVSIPGFANVVNRKNKPIYRTIWALSISLCLVICINQITERIGFFQNTPVAVNVKLQTDMSPPLPRITICSTLNSLRGPLKFDKIFLANFRKDLCRYKGEFRIKFDERNLKILNTEETITNLWRTSECSFFSLLNMTTDEIWQERSLPKDNLFFFGKSKGGGEILEFQYERFNDESGPCITVSLNSTLELQKMNIFVFDNVPMTTSNMGEYNIIYHDDEIPLIPEIQKKSEVYTTGDFTSSMRITKFINLNFTRKPCLTSKQYVNCRQKCLQKQLLAANITCKFPVSLDTASRPSCTTANKCFEGLGQIRNLLFYHIPNECNCPRKCTNIIFSTTTTQTGYTGRYRGFTCLAARISLALPTSHTVIEEFIAYNVIELFCDIGGSMGLCLGLCLISLLDFIQTVIISLKQVLQ